MDININSDTVKLLIKKLSNAIGWVVEPKQIERLAKAEAKSKIIATKADIDSKELYDAYETRKMYQGLKEQQNISKIIHQSLNKISEKISPGDVEDDWLSFFFEKCKIISDEKMQNIWANILTGEFENPGLFSKRTISLIELLDKRDADLFASVCCFGAYHGGDLIPIIDNYNSKIYSDFDLNYETLKHLEHLGLIDFSPHNNVEFTINGSNSYFGYWGQIILIEFDKLDNNKVMIGKVLLTAVGQQLSKICGAHQIEGYYGTLVEYFSKQTGITIE